jgi:hypothetical protein
MYPSVGSSGTGYHNFLPQKFGERIVEIPLYRTVLRLNLPTTKWSSIKGQFQYGTHYF